MERLKWLLVPFAINMMALAITQVVVPNYAVREINPVSNYFYDTFGSFLFCPLWTAFILFCLYPIGIEIMVKYYKKSSGKDKRRFFEWFMIAVSVVIFSIDLANDVWVWLFVAF